MEYILIGKIINTHGIKGELKIEIYTDFIEERFKKNSIIYIGQDYLSFKVKSYRKYKNYLLLTLVDNEDINLIEKYKGLNVYKAINDIKALNDGEYYFRDIEGLNVYINNNKIGQVLNMETGIKYNFMRILKDDDHKEYLVPFLKPFIIEIDINKNIIVLTDLEGLL